jgi:hypothetical protein
LNGNLSGLGAIGNIGQQGYAEHACRGAGAPRRYQQAQNADANTLAGIGSQNMAYQQQLIDAANQNPWLKAGNLAQISGGIAGSAARRAEHRRRHSRMTRSLPSSAVCWPALGCWVTLRAPGLSFSEGRYGRTFRLPWWPD